MHFLSLFFRFTYNIFQLALI